MQTRIRPAASATFASSSESFPSVAEIAVCSSVRNSTGSAPVWRTSARSFASPMSPRPEICAPFDPVIPPGYSSKSTDGHDLISRSSTIAKFWKNGPGSP